MHSLLCLHRSKLIAKTQILFGQKRSSIADAEMVTANVLCCDQLILCTVSLNFYSNNSYQQSLERVVKMKARQKMNITQQAVAKEKMKN